MTDQTFEKNPNGGYLNKSNYGADSWYGRVAITPGLLKDIQNSGFLLLEVKDIQTTQYGDCRRAVAKPYVPRQEAPVQGYAQPQQMQAPAPQQFAPAQPVAHPQNALTNAPQLNDSIPF